ncbi:hypothetical protein Tcan_08474 [Toxocara canis]|uniref:Uncharacterized protein n=1 Tax=Toxocara canis TaxID=6265 RepID=A0A0B2VUY7_TOXCA|nr:hypothetical protein Tcan_08474 [Toxocara canis]
MGWHEMIKEGICDVCSEKLVKVIVGKARTYFMKTAVYLAFREALMSRGRLNLLRKSEVWGLKRNSGAREEDKVEERNVKVFVETHLPMECYATIMFNTKTLKVPELIVC